MKNALYSEAISQFQKLLADAKASGDPDATAMTLSTASPDGRVSARTVLLKDVTTEGFAFYTNTESRKGRQLALNQQCALLFLWKSLLNQVQVKIEGEAVPVTVAEADAYFASRPYISQIGAWASLQSETLESRALLEERVEHYRQEYAEGAVPRPPHWSGYRVHPSLIEFWYGEQYRLHRRDRFEIEDGDWTRRLLYP